MRWIAEFSGPVGTSRVQWPRNVSVQIPYRYNGLGRVLGAEQRRLRPFCYGVKIGLQQIDVLIDLPRSHKVRRYERNVIATPKTVVKYDHNYKGFPTNVKREDRDGFSLPCS